MTFVQDLRPSLPAADALVPEAGEIAGNHVRDDYGAVHDLAVTSRRQFLAEPAVFSCDQRSMPAFREETDGQSRMSPARKPLRPVHRGVDIRARRIESHVECLRVASERRLQVRHAALDEHVVSAGVIVADHAPHKIGRQADVGIQKDDDVARRGENSFVPRRRAPAPPRLTNQPDAR